MNLENATYIDTTFVTADIATEAGTVSLEAEVVAFCPFHIEHATWKETGEDAMSYVAQHLGSVLELLEAALLERA